MPDELHLPEAADQRREAHRDEEDDGEEAPLVRARPAAPDPRGPRTPPHPYLRRARPRSPATTSGTTRAATVAVSRHCTAAAHEVDGGAHGERGQHADPLDDRRRTQGDDGDARRGDRALEPRAAREGAGDGIRERLDAEVGRARRNEVEQPAGGQADGRAGHRAAQQCPGDDEHEHEVGHHGDVPRAEGHDEQHRREHRQAPQQRGHRGAHPVPVATGRGAVRPTVSTTATTSSEVVSTAGVTVPVGRQPADAEVHRGDRADGDAGHERAVADAAEGGDDVTGRGGAPLDEGEREQARRRAGATGQRGPGRLAEHAARADPHARR